jgi:hypothetical protein
MRIVTLALAACIGMAAAPVPAQTADPPSAVSPLPPAVVPAPAQQVPPQDAPAQQPLTQPPSASQPQQAQEQAPSSPALQPRTPTPAPAAERRYSFNRVDDGFVRFDNATGQVAYCSPHTVGWACQAVSEDRAALDQEIARLKDEVAALKQEIAKLKAAPPPPPVPVPPPAAAPPPPADEGDEIRLKLPTHEDLARAQAYLADTWHRLVEMIDRFQRNLRNGGRDAAEDTSSI